MSESIARVESTQGPHHERENEKHRRTRIWHSDPQFMGLNKVIVLYQDQAIKAMATLCQLPTTLKKYN